MRLAVVFPGQGTQSPGMARPWLRSDGQTTVENLADIAAMSDAVGMDLATLVCDAEADDLASTRTAQLAVLTTSMLAWSAVEPLVRATAEIVGYAGHSLGQVSALIASGALALPDGLQFAATRAAATQAAADAHPGKMVAMVGADRDAVAAACDSVRDAWIANDNAPGQIVVAGTAEGVDAAISAAKERGARKALPLAVGGAFHTPLMAAAVPALEAELETVEFAEPHRAVVSNSDALAYSDANGWRERLALHPTLPVEWRATMLYLAHELHAEAFIEVGHGSMIAGVAKRTVSEVPVYPVSSPDDIAKLAEVLA